ncbi:dTDP-6-deoxy-L-hexose 3-O-methyltransferase [Salmonella enterica subsp. enterica serovar Newport]|nr:dTDP-6-deoxy-L-hexose 3-O-methyltransferase [Salmonella enterica subsp. enterica serovar Newport]ECD4580002.1 dTDP-6-deoxy-L-hexose 3-O-methyltransferase [Salmonella enterica subsp. enterica serovar Newport]
MTTITRENAEIKSFITGFLSDPAHDIQSSDSLLANVFRIALASLEAEPVAWKATFTQIDNEYNTFTALYSDKAEVERWVRLHEIGDFRADITPLYAAPPAQAQCIEVAVNDDMAYAFHHALSDSSLGADEVEEIKTGLRAAFANVAVQPALIVPHEWRPSNAQAFIERYSPPSVEEAALFAWNACRAAMLQSQREGNPHVTPARLPGGFTIEDAKELHEDLVRSHISQALSGEKMKKKDRDADLLWIHGVIVQAAWFVKASLDALPEPLREEKGGSPTEESEAGL